MSKIFNKGLYVLNESSHKKTFDKEQHVLERKKEKLRPQI